MPEFKYKRFVDGKHFVISGNSEQYRSIIGVKLYDVVPMDGMNDEAWDDVVRSKICNNVKVEAVRFAKYSGMDAIYIEMRMVDLFMRSLTYDDLADLHSRSLAYLGDNSDCCPIKDLQYNCNCVIVNVLFSLGFNINARYKKHVLYLGDEWQRDGGLVSKLHEAVPNEGRFSKFIETVEVYVTDEFERANVVRSYMMKKEDIASCMRSRYPEVKGTKREVTIHWPNGY